MSKKFLDNCIVVSLEQYIKYNILFNNTIHSLRSMSKLTI
jgi:hypothetical protein